MFLVNVIDLANSDRMQVREALAVVSLPGKNLHPRQGVGVWRR